MTTNKPSDKIFYTPEMHASLEEIAKREGITPVQALRNSLSIGMLSHNYAETTTHHEGGYGYLSLSPRDARKLARLTWL